MSTNSLGLSEFVVDEVQEDADGRSLKYIVHKDSYIRACPHCGSAAVPYRHSPEIRTVEDMPHSGKLVYIEIHTARFKCQDCKRTYYEQFDCIEGKDRVTRRLREHIQERCMIDTFSRISRDFNLTVPSIVRMFNEFVDARIDSLAYSSPRVLGIDEAHLCKKMRCVITDTEHNHLLDIMPDRDAETITSFLRRMHDLQKIEVVTMDMYRPYKSIIQKVLPSAHIVVDHFHVIQLINRKMDEIRASIRKSLDADGRKAMLHIRKLTMANREDIDEDAKQLLMKTFRLYPQLGTAYYLKEQVRTMYNCKSRFQAGLIFKSIIDSIPSSGGPLSSVKTTYKSWANEIMNYFDYPYTNAFTESANNGIKDIYKVARGLSFDQLRYKVLFSTKATKEAKFEFKQATYTKSNAYSLITAKPVGPQKVLVQGFYVDIDELISFL